MHAKSNKNPSYSNLFWLGFVVVNFNNLLKTAYRIK